MIDIYISYGWNDREHSGTDREMAVDQLCAGLKKAGYTILRDKEELKYKDSIREFAQKIGKAYCVVVVVSRKYLRSTHCMSEAVKIIERGDFKERVFPVILDDANLYDDDEMPNVIMYWQDKVKKMQSMADAIEDDTDKLSYLNLKRDYEDIKRRVGNFMDLLKAMVLLDEAVNLETKFQEIITAIITRIRNAQRSNTPDIVSSESSKAESMLFKALTFLNYSKEYKKFHEYYNHKFGLFYIHGFPAGGQYWLAKRFIYAKSQEEGGIDVLKIVETKLHNSNTIERIENYLGVSPGKAYETLAGKLGTAKLVLLVDESDPEYFFREFWCNFLAYLENANLQVTKPFFIFLYDGRDNRKVREAIQAVQPRVYKLSQYTFPLVEIQIQKEKVKSSLIKDWLELLKVVVPGLTLPCTPEQLITTLTSENRYVSEEIIRSICKQFNLRFNDVVEYKELKGEYGILSNRTYD